MTSPSSRQGFSLIEILIVLAILSLLAALLLPAFILVREKAQRVSCLSNLKQIGSAMEMYKQDYDGRFPYAVDPLDRNSPQPPFPTVFQLEIPKLPQINEALQPYCAQTLFRCPSDFGFDFEERTGTPLFARPSSYEKFGTSYYYRTEIAAFQIHEAAISEPTKINLLFDGSGRWHASGLDLWSRYNILFADSHVKNLTRSQFDEAWATPIREP